MTSEHIGNRILQRTLNLWVFRLLGAMALMVSLLAGAERSPLIEPDPYSEEVAVSATEVSVEAPIPIGSLDPESITAPAAADTGHRPRRSDVALPRHVRLPTLRAPPHRPPRLPG